MFKKLELKDYILTGLLSAVYIVVSLIIMTIMSMLGPIGHALSVAVGGVFGGTIIVFMCYKIGKTGIYTLLSLIYLIIVSFMGAFYLPWVISLMACSILADIISSINGYEKCSSQLISYSLISIGNICGSLIPVWFFVDSYKATWIESGMMTVEQMEANIQAHAGITGFVIIAATIILPCIGILIGRKILAKHFNKER